MFSLVSQIPLRNEHKECSSFLFSLLLETRIRNEHKKFSWVNIFAEHFFSRVGCVNYVSEHFYWTIFLFSCGLSVTYATEHFYWTFFSMLFCIYRWCVNLANVHQLCSVGCGDDAEEWTYQICSVVLFSVVLEVRLMSEHEKCLCVHFVVLWVCVICEWIFLLNNF